MESNGRKLKKKNPIIGINYICDSGCGNFTGENQ